MQYYSTLRCANRCAGDEVRHRDGIAIFGVTLGLLCK